MRSHASLRAVLELPVDDTEHALKFMDSLVELVYSRPGARALPPDEQPEIVRMIIMLRALWLDVSTGRIWKYLEEWGAGADFDTLRRWCESIGARRTAEYLAATAKVARARGGQTVIASEDGSELYVFSAAGRILLTLDALTRDTIHRWSAGDAL